MTHPFGDLITQHLGRQHGLSQSKLAAGVDLDPSVISKMCNGKRLTGNSARPRVLAIITWLHAQGVLDRVEEADALLIAAGLAGLTSDEDDEGKLFRKLLDDSRQAVAAASSKGTITFLLMEVEGGIAHREHVTPEGQRALDRSAAIARQAIVAHTGMIFKVVEESIYAAFVTAPDALRAAVEAQMAIMSYPDPTSRPLPLRMAIHTGTVERRDGDYLGLPVSRAARLLAAGHGGQVLLSAAARELVRDDLPAGAGLHDLGDHRLKDLTRPEHIFQLVAPNLPTNFPSLQTLDRHLTNLPPQAMPLVGREQEIAKLRGLLVRPEVRSLTLTGPGGVGKTRLGLQVAAELLDAFADGIYYVALAATTHRDQVTAAIAQALQIKETGGASLLDNVQRHLRDKQLLLLLDNVEHVAMQAAPLIVELLMGAPGLKLLMTSQVSVRVSGEQEFPVTPLSLPNLQDLPPVEVLSDYSAVELFIQRARAVRPDFTLSDNNARAVAEICVRVDGLPLAIELAAARIKLFSPIHLLERLTNRLQLLTGGPRDLPARQQTLQSTIDWSCSLLEAAEKTLFQRLALFVGGCTLSAITAVCYMESVSSLTPTHRSSEDILDDVASLLDKNLLRQAEGAELDDEPRYVMLETIREYALNLLEHGDDTDELRRRHAAYYLTLAGTAAPKLRGAEQGVWLVRLERDHDNLRMALHTLGASEQGMQLATALGPFWETRGYWSEGRRWIEDILKRTRAIADPQQRALLSYESGRLARHQGDYEQATNLLQESKRLCEQLGHEAGIAAALGDLGWIAYDQGNYGQATAWLEQSAALFETVGDRWGRAKSLNDRGWVAYDQGDYGHAAELLEASEALFRELGDRWGLAWALRNLGEVTRAQGNYKRATELFEEHLTLFRELGDKEGIARSLSSLGELARAEQHYDQARARYEESLAVCRELGDKGGIARLLNDLGEVHRYQKQFEQATALYQQSHRLFRELGDNGGRVWPLRNLAEVERAQGHYQQAVALYRESLAVHGAEGNKILIALCLTGLARVAGSTGQLERAARLFGATRILLNTIGRLIAADDHAIYTLGKDAVQAQLGAETFDKLYHEGKAMTIEQAIAYALEEQT